MAIRSSFLLAALIALAAFVPVATADTPLPETRTHIDSDGMANQASHDHDDDDGQNLRLTLFKGATRAEDVRRGYLVVLLRCNQRCVVKVTAKTKIGAKRRVIATARRTLPAGKTRRVKLKIQSKMRRRIPSTARFYYNASLSAPRAR